MYQIYWDLCSDHDTFCLRQTKKQSILFKTLDIRHRRTAIPERWETCKMNPTITSDFPGSGIGREKLRKSPRSPCIRRLRNTGKPRQLEHTGQSPREWKSGRGASQICRVIALWLEPVDVEMAQGWQTVHLKGLEETISRNHSEPEIVPLPTSQRGKVHSYWGSGELCLSSGQN